MDESVERFDEVLRDKQAQSEFDRRVTKALETARLRWEKEAGAGKTEELDARERALERRETALAARGLLLERGLPEELLSAVSLDGADAMQKSVDALDAAFTKCVRGEVDLRLRASLAPRETRSDAEPVTDREYYESVRRKKREE